MPYIDNRDLEAARRYGKIIDEEGLVLYAPMSEGAGTLTKNKSKYRGLNNGTLAGGTAWVNTPWGKGIRFDGSTGYVDCGSDPSLNITDAITVEAWTKSNDVVSPNVIAGKGYGIEQVYVFRINDGKLHFFYSSPAGSWRGLEDSRILNNGVWYHVVIVDYANGNMDFYQNGVVKAGTASIGLGNPTGYPKLPNNYALLIGNKGGYTQYFNGIIDEVRIYNRALSAAEIKRHYKAKVLEAREWYLSKAYATRGVIRRGVAI